MDDIRLANDSVNRCKVIDRRGYCKVLTMMPRRVWQTIMHRLGPLNIIDPLAPVGSYEFDMGRMDERYACDLLVRLSQKGPGYFADIEYNGKAHVAP